jgi:hypothetical protein
MRRSTSVGLSIILAAAFAGGCSDDPTRPSELVPQFTESGGGCTVECEEEGIPGRMTGGGGSITLGDVSVSKGLTLHCDITLSNNLEINWAGNRWHLDKPISSANCVDDPAVDPAPPPAPFDTFNGTAVGRLNGVDGYSITFSFQDAGEPGGKNDKAGLTIMAPDGVTMVLHVPFGFTTRGNLQAHYDQPHR